MFFFPSVVSSFGNSQSTTDLSFKMSSLTGRVYTVTGAASGIGQAVAVRLVQLGAAGLALSDVNMENLEKTKALCQ